MTGENIKIFKNFGNFIKNEGVGFTRVYNNKQQYIHTIHTYIHYFLHCYTRFREVFL